MSFVSEMSQVVNQGCPCCVNVRQLRVCRLDISYCAHGIYSCHNGGLEAYPNSASLAAMFERLGAVLDRGSFCI